MNPEDTSLFKLRDLPDNIWNADKLFVLTRTEAQAHELVQIAEEEDCAGEVYVHENQEEIDSVLGTGRDEFGLMIVSRD